MAQAKLDPPAAAVHFPTDFSSELKDGRDPFQPVPSTSRTPITNNNTTSALDCHVWPEGDGSSLRKPQWTVVKTTRESLLQDLEQRHARARSRPHGKSPVRSHEHPDFGSDSQEEEGDSGEGDNSEVEHQALIPAPVQSTLSKTPQFEAVPLPQDTSQPAAPRLQFNSLVRIAGQRPHKPSSSAAAAATGEAPFPPLLRPHPRRNSSVVTPSVLSRSSSPASSIYAPLASTIPSVPSPRRALHFFHWSRKGLQAPADLANVPHSDANYRTLVQEQSHRRAMRSGQAQRHQARGRRARRRSSVSSSGIDEEEHQEDGGPTASLWRRLWPGQQAGHFRKGGSSSEREALLDSDWDDLQDPVSWSNTLFSWFCCCCMSLDESSDDEG